MNKLKPYLAEIIVLNRHENKTTHTISEILQISALKSRNVDFRLYISIYPYKVCVWDMVHGRRYIIYIYII